MNDPEIRAVLLARLRSDPSLFIREEHGVGYQSIRTVVFDVLTVSEIIHGYEIKSDGDSLTRLRTQEPACSAVCDRVTIVVGASHTKAVVRRVPDWWGIEEAAGDDSILLRVVREARDNASPNATAIADMLWCDELRQVARRFGFRSKGCKRDLTARLVAALTLDELRAEVRFALRTHEYRRERLRAAA